MVFVVGVAAALLLGIGYVLQQRVAARMPMADVLRVRLLFDLMRHRQWWVGIGAMVAGQGLAGWALQLGTVSRVEPLLSTNLLFALATATVLAGQRPRLAELGGAALVSAALGVFIEVGDPRSGTWHGSPVWAQGLAVSVIVAAVSLAVGIGRGRRLVGESIWIATAAGILYGLQDAATRASLVELDRGGWTALLGHSWGYVVVLAATAGILLSQSAFKAARLDWSLPPITVAEPVVGIALGIGLLGDSVSITAGGMAVEAVCLVVMVAGVIMVGRSAALASPNCDRTDAQRRGSGATAAD